MSVHHADAKTGLVASTIPFSSVDGPGNRFVVFFQGCNFDCVACHNPQTIAEGPHTGQSRSVEELLEEIRRAGPFLSGVTVSGGEPTRQAGFVRELFAAVKADPALADLTTLVDTNGSAALDVWDDLAPVMDGAMVDLKALDPDLHVQMTGQPNEATLASIRHLAAIDRLHEVRLLLIAGLNDDPALLDRTADCLAEIDPAMRLKLIGFRRHGVRPVGADLGEPDADRMADHVQRFAARGFTEIECV